MWAIFPLKPLEEIYRFAFLVFCLDYTHSHVQIANFGRFSGIFGFNCYLLLQYRCWLLCDVGDFPPQAFRRDLPIRFFELGASIRIVACTLWSPTLALVYRGLNFPYLRIYLVEKFLIHFYFKLI